MKNNSGSNKKPNFRILLVYANKMMENLIPINISILSAALKENGFEVRLFDSTYYRTESASVDQVRVDNLQLRDFDLSKYGIHFKNNDIHKDFLREAAEYKPDIIGINFVEDTFRLGISLLKAAKNLNVPTIAGGVHTIISPEEVMREDAVDMVCIGEGERSLVELCQKMQNGEDYTDVHGIWFKKDGRIIKNPSNKNLVDINKLPYLDFTVYEKERFYRPVQGEVYRMLPVEVSRGCPYSCAYCAGVALKEIYKSSGIYYRRKKIEKVIEEIKFYIDKYNLGYVYFTAETFLSMNDNEFKKFVSLYKDIKLPFWCQTRPETIREDRIKMLEDINCDRITIGVESGNERIRKEVLNRNISNDLMIRAFNILRRSSIPVSVNNLIGLPDETREDIFDTINLNRAIGADSTSVFIFTPYKGSRLRQYCIEKGYIAPDACSAGNVKSSILNMPSISGEEIRGIFRTFPLYVKFPKEDYELIKRAEKFDEEGNRIFKELRQRYKKEYFS